MYANWEYLLGHVGSLNKVSLLMASEQERLHESDLDFAILQLC